MKEKISVCIATYKRPELLTKLLDSIFYQKDIDDYLLEIIVVDNDPAKSAESVITDFKNKIKNNNRISIRYDVQPIKNISLTRNKTVELATGNYLFFIDDDEYADEYCIHHHLRVINEFSADVTFGNVLPYFSIDVPDYIRSAPPLTRKNNKDGLYSRYFITGNTVVNLNKIDKNEIHFDPNYGLTGGEDHSLFSRLNLKGYKLVSCSSSITYENIPENRANTKWLIMRVFRTGNNYTRILIKQSDYKFKKILISSGQLLKGLFQSILAAFFCLTTFFFNRDKSFNWFLKSISNIAKVFAVFGYYPQEYKKK